MKTLQDKTAVVTGGSGNLGSAIATALVAAGAQVAITGRDEAHLAPLAQEIGVEHALVMDANDADSLSDCVAAATSALGRVDILVNCIGGNAKSATTSADRTFFDLELGNLTKVLDLNWLHGVVAPSQAFGKVMVDNPSGGSIINISSMAAERPLTRVAAYSAAKAAVDNFTRWLAVYLAQEYSADLRVNAIAPGFFLSEQNRYLLQDADGKLTDRGEAIIAQTPMKRFGEASEVGGAVVWLASDAARFVTGIVVPVDGGFSAFAGV